MINVRLYTTLRKYCHNADVNLPIQVECEAEMTIGKLATKMGVSETEIMLAAVNNQMAGHNQVVQDGDEVSLFGAIGGGDHLALMPGSLYEVEQAFQPVPGKAAGTRQAGKPIVPFFGRKAARRRGMYCVCTSNPPEEEPK